MPLISVPELKREARGQWGYILQDLAPELAEAIDRAPNHVPCPLEGGVDGFRMWPDFQDTGGGVSNKHGMFQDGFSLLMWLKGYSFSDAVKEVFRCVKNESSAPVPVRKPVYAGPDRTKAKASIDKVLSQSRKFPADENNPVTRYLAGRGIIFKRLPKDLLFHPSHSYWDAESKSDLGRYPTMVFPVRNVAGEIMSLHRTYLSDNGNKAKVPKAKKLMPGCGKISGSAIRLSEISGEEMGFAEGVETALAVIKATRMPVWATVSSTMMQTVQIPPEIRAKLKKVHIWADLDSAKEKAGIKGAEILAKRLREDGLEVEIHLPDIPIPPTEKSVDWLDVLNQVGLQGFPQELIRKPARKAA